MKSRIRFYFAAIAALTLFTATLTAGTYGGGTGTPEDPYQIWTPEQMNTIGANPIDWNKHFKLMTDINMSIYTGTQYNIIGNSDTYFTGTFNGNGHVIHNLAYTTTTDVRFVGLFGQTFNSTIQNLGLENVSISSSSSHVGGLVAQTWYGIVASCYVTGSVWGKTYSVGGLIGENHYGVITSCYVTASVTGTGNGVGGLVGDVWQGSLNACYASSSVSGHDRVGGLVGVISSSSSVYSCYSSGTVTGHSAVGGFAGANNSDCTLTGCFWDMQTSGLSVGVGYGKSAGVTG
ncbi:MAG: hypothetical protein JXA82_17205, partial [Sedimentisphaerales bacterium]|nr:hypothetical protein [Sedimentisphaerales bacterium]